VYEARRARREMSLPEVLLWQRLKGSPQGIAFRKQHPIGTYRADFYCAAAKLIIEVDGIAHDMGDRPARDLTRTSMLEAQGYHVLRVPASDVLRNADQAAASVIAYAVAPPPPLARRARAVPLPAKRGG
jgi:very-short-patch-repair endonuclease